MSKLKKQVSFLPSIKLKKAVIKPPMSREVKVIALAVILLIISSAGLIFLSSAAVSSTVTLDQTNVLAL